MSLYLEIKSCDYDERWKTFKCGHINWLGALKVGN